jgi:DNA-binding protein H-NS
MNLQKMDATALAELLDAIDDQLAARLVKLTTTAQQIEKTIGQKVKGQTTKGQTTKGQVTKGQVTKGQVTTGLAMKGQKLPPKFRDPKNPNNTWAGRGMRPKWMGKRNPEKFRIAA